MFNLKSIVEKLGLTKTAENNPFIDALASNPEFAGKLQDYQSNQKQAPSRVQAQEFPPVRDGVLDIASDTFNDFAGDIGHAAKSKLTRMRNNYIDAPMQDFFKREFDEEFVPPSVRDSVGANTKHLDNLQMKALGRVVRGPQHDANDLMTSGKIQDDFDSKYLKPLLDTQRMKREQGLESIGQQLHMGAPIEEVLQNYSKIKSDQQTGFQNFDSIMSSVDDVESGESEEEKRRRALLNRLMSRLK